MNRSARFIETGVSPLTDKNTGDSFVAPALVDWVRERVECTGTRGVFVPGEIDVLKSSSLNELEFMCQHFDVVERQKFLLWLFHSVKETFFERNISIPNGIKTFFHTDLYARTYTISYIQENLAKVLENPFISLQTEMSFFLFLLWMDDDFDMVRDLAVGESQEVSDKEEKFEKIQNLSKKLGSALIDTNRPQSISFDFYTQFCEVINKIAAVHAVNFRDRAIMLQLTGIIEQKLLDIEKHLRKTWINTDKFVNLRWRLKVSYANGRAIDGNTKEEILSQLAEIHREQNEGLSLCASVRYGNIGESPIRWAYEGNRAQSTLIAIRRMEELWIPYDELQQEEKGCMDVLIRLYGKVSEGVTTPQAVVLDSIKNLKDHRSLSRMSIESLHHILRNDSSVSLDSLKELLSIFMGKKDSDDQKNEWKVENNFFYEEYRIKIIDVILQKFASNDAMDIEEKILHISEVVAYIWQSQKLSASVLSYSKIYLTIAETLAYICHNEDYRNQKHNDRLLEYYHYFQNLSGVDVSLELREKSRAVLWAIGRLSQTESARGLNLPTESVDWFVNSGITHMERYTARFYSDAMNAIGRIITDAARKKNLTESAVEDIKDTICRQIEWEIFWGICTVAIVKNCPCHGSESSAEKCDDCRNKRGFWERSIPLDWLEYRLSIVFPVSSEEIFLKIFEREKDSMGQTIAAILELRLKELSIGKLAYEDPETGLPNKNRLRHDLQEISSLWGVPTVVLIEVPDYHTIINTAWGEEKWEARMKWVLEELRTGERAAQESVNPDLSVGTIYRKDDSTFALVSNSSAEETKKLLEFLPPGSFPVHIGMVAWESENTLLKASIALLNAKKARGSSGTSEIREFNPKDQEALDKVLHNMEVLRQALDENNTAVQIVPHYQPICDADGRVVKYEALARIEIEKDGAKTIVYPWDFIPLAEENGQSPQITMIMLRKIEKDLRLDPEMQVTINMNAQDWNNSEVGQKLRNMSFNGISNRIELEILETVRLNRSDDLQKLQDFKKGGFNLAVDDYGTGHSHAVRIAKIKPRYLKIDREIVDMLSDENPLVREDGRKLIQEAVNTAHAFGVHVVAEFVINAEVCRILKSCGVEFFQGEYFGMAKPFGSRKITSSINVGIFWWGGIIRRIGDRIKDIFSDK